MDMDGMCAILPISLVRLGTETTKRVLTHILHSNNPNYNESQAQISFSLFVPRVPCLLFLSCSFQTNNAPPSSSLHPFKPLTTCILLIQAPADGWSARVHLASHPSRKQSPSLAHPAPPVSSPNSQPALHARSCLHNNTHDPHSSHLAHGSSASAPSRFKVSSGIGILAIEIVSETPTC